MGKNGRIFFDSVYHWTYPTWFFWLGNYHSYWFTVTVSSFYLRNNRSIFWNDNFNTSVNILIRFCYICILRNAYVISDFWVTILSVTYCDPIECQWCTTWTYKCFCSKSSSTDVVYAYFLTVIISIGFWVGCYHFRCSWEWSFKCNVYSLFFFGCYSKYSSTGICMVTILCSWSSMYFGCGIQYIIRKYRLHRILQSLQHQCKPL